MGALEETRTVMAIVRDTLLIVVLIAIIYVGANIVLAIHKSQTERSTPETQSTCIVPDLNDPSKCIVTK